MGLRMKYVVEHPKTGKWWYRRPTPRDLLAKRRELGAMGVKVTLEVKHSLRASSEADAELKGTEANKAFLLRRDAMRNALANGPASLTQKQIASLAGDIARQALGSDAEVSDDIVEAKGLGKLRVSWQQTADIFKLIELHGLARYPSVEAVVARLIQGELLKQGIIAVDQQSLHQLKARIVRDLPNVAKMLAAMQDDGDYREPEWLVGRPKPAEVFAKAVTFAALIEGWKRSDAQPKADSVRAYEGRIKAFTKWLGHSDAAKVTRADMQGWKDAMLDSEGRNLKGIKIKLDAVRSLFNWGIKNARLPFLDNPASGVSVSLKKHGKQRRGYSDDEARLILRAARGQQGFLRWGTWMMAYTGTRPHEVAQLRVADLMEDDLGRWAVKVMLEAGTAKTPASERTIPLHSVMVSEGFPEYVKALGREGRLFPELYASPTFKGLSAEDASRKAGRIARDAMRKMLGTIEGFAKASDISIQHSWRHRMTSMMRDDFQSYPALQAVLGHKGTSVTDGYGARAALRRLREEVERIPVLELEAGASGGPKAGVTVVQRNRRASREQMGRVQKVKLEARTKA